MKPEPFIIGVTKIREHLGGGHPWSFRKWYRHRPQMFKAGVLITTTLKAKGDNWTRRRVVSKPSWLDAWMIRKASKGEFI